MESLTKIAVIGGGSGISVILRGLKKYTENITAIVTVADDGGSSGVIREDLGMLPPGDIRNCIVALSNVEPVMAEIMQHRFGSGKFDGHALGNIIIAGLVDMKGSFELALPLVHSIFAVTGRVLPVSLDDIVLSAKLKNGSTVIGESNIPKVVLKENSPIERVLIQPHNARAFQPSIDAIMEADIVLLGPGSLFTSVMPSLLISRIKKAIMTTTAKVVVPVNLMTQPGETDNMTIYQHLKVIIDQIGADTIDYALINNQGITSEAQNKYAQKGAHILTFDDAQRQKIKLEGINVIEAKLLEEYAGYVRHDAYKFSKIILGLEND